MSHHMMSASLSVPTIKKPMELPPTPTSSYCRSIISRDDSTKLASMNTDNSMEKVDRSTTSNLLSTRNYGSFISIPPLSEDNLSLNSVAPSTPSHTTINPDEDDEGLYLLWTQQLLREQGLRPSSFRTKSFQYDDDDDFSDESSLSNISTSKSFLSSFFSLCCS
ncbi:unnamed protein product [Cunninghamella blakesleeana]